MIDLCEFSRTDKWSLLFRCTRDGFSTNDFHSNCDGHSNTLTILKAKKVVLFLVDIQQDILQQERCHYKISLKSNTDFEILNENGLIKVNFRNCDNKSLSINNFLSHSGLHKIIYKEQEEKYLLQLNFSFMLKKK